MDTIGLLTELVARKTVSGEPGPQVSAMEAIESAIRAAHPAVEVVGDRSGSSPWSLLTNDAPPSAPRLMFACHVDTVPAGDLGNWEFDPFAGQVHGGVLLGRGTSDMKAGVAAATAAVLDAFGSGVPAALLLTSDEEIGSLGAVAARAAVADRSIGAVIVPEATGNRIHLGHRGALWLEIRTRGVAAHGSTPDRGKNAVLSLVDVLGRARDRLPLSHDDFLGDETWNVGLVDGGSAPNIVPDSARAVVDHRTVGDGAELLAWWRRQPEVDTVNISIDLRGVRTARDAPWLDTLAEPIAQEPVSYFTDASILASAAPDAPIVIWGPGTPALMHAANETVDISEMYDASAAYRAAVAAWPAVD